MRYNLAAEAVQGGYMLVVKGVKKDRTAPVRG
jgi:hypothetical protein